MAALCLRTVPTAPLGGSARKWLGLCTGLLWMVVCGAGYAYSSFTHDLQALGYKDVALIGSLGNVGSYVLAILAGLVLDRFGSRVLSVQSMLLVTLGWACFRAAIIYSPGNDGAAAMCFLTMGLGGISGYLSVVNSVEGQFPTRHRGLIHGLLLAMYVLGSAIWASVYYGLFQGQLLAFTTVMAVLGAVLGSVNAFLQVDHIRFKAWVEAEIALHDAAAQAAGFVVPAPLTGLGKTPGTNALIAIPAGSGASVASSLPGIAPTPTHSALELGSASSSSGAGSAPDAAAPPPHVRRLSAQELGHKLAHLSELAYPIHAPWGDGGFEEKHHLAEEAGQHDSFVKILLWRSLLSGFAYALYVLVFATAGTARIFVNGAGLAIKAMAGPNDPSPMETAAFVRNIVVIFSVSDWVGRVASGVIGDKLSARGISRVHLYTPACVCILAASYILAFAEISQGVIIAGAVLMGLGDGLGFVAWAVVVKDVFTPKRYGRFFALYDSAVGFGSLALNGMASAYQRQYGYQQPNGSIACYGENCFKWTWVIAGSLVAAFGLVLTFFVVELVYAKGLLTPPTAAAAVEERMRRASAAPGPGKGSNASLSALTGVSSSTPTPAVGSTPHIGMTPAASETNLAAAAGLAQQPVEALTVRPAAALPTVGAAPVTIIQQ